MTNFGVFFAFFSFHTCSFFWIFFPIATACSPTILQKNKNWGTVWKLGKKLQRSNLPQNQFLSKSFGIWKLAEMANQLQIALKPYEFERVFNPPVAMTAYSWVIRCLIFSRFEATFLLRPPLPPPPAFDTFCGRFKGSIEIIVRKWTSIRCKTARVLTTIIKNWKMKAFR